MGQALNKPAWIRSVSGAGFVIVAGSTCEFRGVEEQTTGPPPPPEQTCASPLGPDAGVGDLKMLLEGAVGERSGVSSNVEAMAKAGLAICTYCWTLVEPGDAGQITEVPMGTVT